MQAMIFAAGLGTRLKPLTDTMPKALVKVGERPLLDRVIMRLKEAGASHIVVNVHHFSEQIIDYLQTNSYGISIDISDETEQLLDTGGGIKRAASLFKQDEPVLIHNVDILSNVDLASFYYHATTNDSTTTATDALLLVSVRTTQRYLIFSEEMRLMGWTNVSTGEVKSPYAALQGLRFEVPSETDPHALQHGYHLYAFSGIHAIAPSALKTMQEEEGEVFPIIDFYLRHCKKLNFQGEVKRDLKLMDVGKIGSLKEAEAFVQLRER